MPSVKVDGQTRAKTSSKGRKRATEETPTARSLREQFDRLEPREIFTEYGRTGAESIRNYLMEKYLPLVRYNAERIHTRLPDEVDIEDLMSAGVFGLIDAINAFDIDYGVKFETYCAPRIRGAILDHLRGMDWVPRLVRQRTAKVESARAAIEMETGTAPTDADIAKRLGVDEEEFKKLQRDSSAVSITSLSRRWTNSDSGRESREMDVIREDPRSNPLTEAQRRDLKDLITKGLSRAERLIVILYYYEEMTMKEIGQTLDLSESRVSQMHSSILMRLKAQMQSRSREFDND